MLYTSSRWTKLELGFQEDEATIMTYVSNIKPDNFVDATYVRAPDSYDRLLRLPEVMDRVGLKKSAIYDRMKTGRFPQSRMLGPRYVVWVESEIDEWVREVATIRSTIMSKPITS